MNNIETIPLQQRKQARTRLALLDAVFEMLRSKALADITVDEICREVEISKVTFFRYFPRKVDLIFYYIRLLNIELTWSINNLKDNISGLAAVELIFDKTAEAIKDNPRFFSEFISLRALEPETFFDAVKRQNLVVSRAERLIRFPEMDDIDLIVEKNFDEILQNHLETAIANEELPDTTDIEDAILSVVGILYSVPLMVDSQNLLKNLSETFQRQLQILWTGLRNMEPQKR